MHLSLRVSVLVSLMATLPIPYSVLAEAMSMIHSILVVLCEDTPCVVTTLTGIRLMQGGDVLIEADQIKIDSSQSLQGFQTPVRLDIICRQLLS